MSGTWALGQHTFTLQQSGGAIRIQNDNDDGATTTLTATVDERCRVSITYVEAAIGDGTGYTRYRYRVWHAGNRKVRGKRHTCDLADKPEAVACPHTERDTAVAGLIR